jgi:hypothetical protein
MIFLDNTALVVVSGIHPPSYTANLLVMAAADPVLSQVPILVFPAQPATTVLSAHSLRHWLDHLSSPTTDAQIPSLGPTHLLIWAFSAGCLGAMGLAHYWQQYRGQVLALFALDGWGVPLASTLPVYRLSHDRFTHTTSQVLGTGPINFYADPPIPHLDLWRHPQRVEGWQTTTASLGDRTTQRLTAADFLCYWSRQCLLSRQTP